MRDENLKGRVMLGMSNSQDGPVLLLYDENGELRIVQGVLKKGPVLGMYDENGTNRVIVRAGQTKTPDGKVITHPLSSLWLIGQDGKVIWQAP